MPHMMTIYAGNGRKIDHQYYYTGGTPWFFQQVYDACVMQMKCKAYRHLGDMHTDLTTNLMQDEAFVTGAYKFFRGENADPKDDSLYNQGYYVRGLVHTCLQGAYDWRPENSFDYNKTLINIFSQYDAHAINRYAIAWGRKDRSGESLNGEPWFSVDIFNALDLAFKASMRVPDVQSATRFLKEALAADAAFLGRAEEFYRSMGRVFEPAAAIDDLLDCNKLFYQERNYFHSPHRPENITTENRQRRKAYLVDYTADPLFAVRKEYAYYAFDDAKPWFMQPVFDAYAATIREANGIYQRPVEAKDAVVQRLNSSADFVKKAEDFYRIFFGWFDESAVNRLVETYMHDHIVHKSSFDSEIGMSKLNQLINSAKPKPYSEEDAALVYQHLRKVLKTGKFVTPQSADGAVAISMRDAGIADFPASRVRKIITTEARGDYERFRRLLANVDPDHREDDESVGAMETSLQRRIGAPTGSFGSTQSARRGPR